MSNRRKPPVLAVLLTGIVLLAPVRIAGQSEILMPPQEVLPQSETVIVDPVQLELNRQPLPSKEPTTPLPSIPLASPEIEKLPPPESSPTVPNIGGPVTLPKSQILNQPPVLALPASASAEPTTPTELMPPVGPSEVAPPQPPPPSAPSVEVQPPPSPPPMPVGPQTAIENGSPQSLPPMEEAGPPPPQETEEADEGEQHPVEPQQPTIAKDGHQDDNHARDRRRDEGRYETIRAQHIQQSVGAAAARAGEDGGQGVVSVRRGGGPETAPDLTSQIDSVSQGMTVTNNPVVSTPPPGPMIYYTVGGSPIPVSDDGSTPTPTSTDTPSSTPEPTPVSTGTPTPTSTPNPTPVSSPPPSTGIAPIPTGTTTTMTTGTTTTTTSSTAYGTTRERRPPLGPTRPRDREWPVPPEEPEDIFLTPPPPVIYGEELDEEEEKPCCGMTEAAVFFPKTVDWLVPAEEQEARNDRAESGQGVLLHDGSYALDQSDLYVASVGFPMQLSHHYRSNLEETVKGGIIGHKWDLGINKRIVAEGGGETADHLVFERFGIDTPRLVYYDGHGRADRYNGAGSEVRTVRNFGAQFKALVTTYSSPPGAFHEIQRYVLLDREKHPFQKHVNVDDKQRIFYVLREKNGLNYIFNCRGQLIYIIDRHKNQMELRYQGKLNPLTHNPMLSLVLDTAGRKYTFDTLTLPADEATIVTNIYCKPVNGKLPIPRFKSITDDANGRQVSFQYKDGMHPVLQSVTLTYDRSLQHKYTYGGGEDYLLTSVTAPEQAFNDGGPYLTNSWDTQKKRVRSQQWGTGTYRMTYTGDPRVTASEVIDPVGGKTEYKLARVAGGPVLEEMTLTGQHAMSSGPWTHRFSHNGATQVTRITYPKGNSIEFQYEGGNKSVRLGPIRNWVERNVTYVNNLQQGNLTGITLRSNDSDDPYQTITVTKSYEDLYNQLDLEVDRRGNRTVHLYDYDRGTGFNGKAYETQLPDLTRPTTSKLTGLMQTFAYSRQGLLLSETDAGGRTTSYAYNPSGYLTRMTTPAGMTSYEVDDRGNVTRTTLPGGRQDTSTYNLRDLQTEAVIDEKGFANKATFRYDLNGNLKRRTTEIKDNFDSRVTTGRRPVGASPGELVETFTYDILNRQTNAATSGPGVLTAITRQFDGVGNVTSMTSPSFSGSGTVTTNTVYDARGLVMEEVEGAGSNAEIRKAFRYDDNGNLTTFFGPEDLEEQYDFDGFDRVKSKVLVTGAEATFERDEADNITKLTLRGASGRSATRRMDIIELGRTEFTYDEMNHMVTRKRHLLASPGTQDEHWILNRALEIEMQKGPGQATTSHAYDNAGRLVSTTDPSGTVTQHQYDSAGHRSGLVEQWTARTYGGARAGWSEASTSRRWTFTNDSLGRMIQQDGPDGTTKHFYDSAGNMRGTLDETDALISKTFDAAGRTLTASAAENTETYTYSAAGKMLTARSRNRDEEWQYSDMGGLLAHSDNRAGQTTRHQLDANGVPVTTTDPNGTQIRRELDPAGKPTRITIVPARFGVSYGDRFHSGYEGPRSEDFRYDGLGRIAYAATNGGTIVERKYDGLGNVIEDKQTYNGDTQVVGTAYAADQSFRDLTYPAIAGGQKVTARLDTLGRVTAISGAGADLARYYYSGKGYLNQRHYGNFVDTAYTYDSRMRLTNIAVMHGAGPSTYSTYWSGRASYDGGTPTQIMQVMSPQDGPEQLMTVRTQLDANKRPLSTVTNQATMAYLGQSATSMTSGVMREYDATGRPTTVVEYLRDDLAPQGRSAGKMVHIQADTLAYNNAGRVASTTSQANLDIAGNTSPTFSQARDLAQQGAHRHRQDFHFDRNGNLLSDDRFVYSYDHRNRLTKIYDRWTPYGFNELSLIEYDALGRRVAIRNRQPGRSGGFVQWGPTYIPDIRFLYDGEVPIAETLANHPDARGEVLLARYYYGTGPSDLIRMDRRHGDNPTASFDTYYIHQGFGGSTALLTDGGGDPTNASMLDPPGRNRPGAAGSPPGDRIVVNHTLTRAPYVSSRIRIDGFAGMQFDVETGRYLFDFQRNYILDRDISTAQFRESITRFQNKGAVILVGLTTLPFTVTSGWALLSGAVGLGLDWGTAMRTQSGYSVEQGAKTFAISATGGRLGVAAGNVGGGLLAKYSASVAVDTAYGTLIQHGWYDRPFGEALSSSLKDALVYNTVGFAAGLTVPLVFKGAVKMYNSYRARPATAFAEAGAGGASVRKTPGRSVEEGSITHCPLCFAKDTRVLTEGGWKAIQDVVVGDRVFARDEASGASGYKAVTKTFVTHPERFAHLYYRLRESGRHDGGDADADDEAHAGNAILELVGTPTHPIWSTSRNQWVDMAELAPGEQLLLSNGKAAEVVRSETRNAPEGTSFTAYNFSVEDWTSYFAAPAGRDAFASAIWVHNTSSGGCRVKLNVDHGNNPKLQKLAEAIHKTLNEFRTAKPSDTEFGIRDMYETELDVVEGIMQSHNSGQPIWLYRGLGAKPESSALYHLYTSGKQGRAASMGSSKDYAGHVQNNPNTKSDATSWSVDLDVVLNRFSGRKTDGVLLVLELRDVVKQVIASYSRSFSKYPDEAELLLLSGRSPGLQADFLKRPGQIWTPKLLEF